MNALIYTPSRQQADDQRASTMKDVPVNYLLPEQIDEVIHAWIDTAVLVPAGN
jgi:hypothetical protein